MGFKDLVLASLSLSVLELSKTHSTWACYEFAFLLKVLNSNINHESNESIYRRQVCMEMELKKGRR